ncbi:hypothetical protein OG750_26830 [Streptomyces sp. NBC_01538]
MTGKRKHYKKRTLNFPWSKQTASRARKAEDGTDLDPLLAHRSGIRRTDEIQTVGESWQAVRTLTSVDDTYGLPIRVETAVVKPNGSTGETLSDRTCTVTTYVHNPSAWLIGLPKSQRSTGTSCADYAAADPVGTTACQAHERSTRGNAVASRGRTSAKNGYTTSRDAIRWASRSRRCGTRRAATTQTVSRVTTWTTVPRAPRR